MQQAPCFGFDLLLVGRQAGRRVGSARNRESRAGIRANGNTKSTRPVAIALCGMLSYSASMGSCTIARPPRSLISRSPSVPSEPLPVRMTPMALAVVRLGQRAEKVVDRGPLLTPLLQLRQTQMRVNRVQIGVRRNDIDLVRLQRQRLCDLAHGNVNVGLEDFGQVALMLWRKMHDNT